MSQGFTQQYNVSVAGVTSIGISMPTTFTVTNSPVTTSGTIDVTWGTQSANLVFAGPSSGSDAAPSFRALVGADLPSPDLTTLGGIQAIDAVSHKWINSISTSGVPNLTQPTDADISFSDVTTGDVSTTAHGYCPKAPNSTTEFLRGDGTWAIPAGSGSVAEVDTAGLATGGPITTSGTITVTAASATDQHTGTSTTVAVVPNVQQNHDSALKAWFQATISGGTLTVNSSFNVSSVTRNSSGDYTVNFSTAFAAANYGIMGCVDNGGTSNFIIKKNGGTYSTSAFEFFTESLSGTVADPAFISAAFFGRA